MKLHLSVYPTLFLVRRVTRPVTHPSQPDFFPSFSAGE